MFFSLALLVPFSVFAEEPPAAPPLQPAILITEADLQTLERDTAFEATAASLDLESPAYALEYKTSGTSLGFKIKKGSEKIGKWLPKNESADPEAQVVSYRLGRFLQMSDLVVPSAYHTVRGRALSDFARMLAARTEGWNAVRRKNWIRIRDALSRNRSEMFGALTAPTDSLEVANLIISGSNTINRAHPVAGFIRADGPMPTDREMSLDRRRAKNGHMPVNSELQLAREFSKIMVLDILTGQYDRWTGGNVEETFNPDGSLHFIARDNGGAGMSGGGSMTKYFGIVSRFDRAQTLLVSRLADALRQNPAEVARLLQMRSNPKVLAVRAATLLDQVTRLVRLYGEDRVYFPN